MVAWGWKAEILESPAWEGFEGLLAQGFPNMVLHLALLHKECPDLCQAKH